MRQRISSAWKAGIATVLLTPDRPMWMAGYAARTNMSPRAKSPAE